MMGNEPAFTNVFVNPAAYRSFLATGKWPDKTMLLLEVRASASKGSINKGGSYQGDVAGYRKRSEGHREVSGERLGVFRVRQIKHRPDAATHRGLLCCHRDHAAVDNTFVQFYPVLLDIAKQKGTLTAGR